MKNLKKYIGSEKVSVPHIEKERDFLEHQRIVMQNQMRPNLSLMDSMNATPLARSPLTTPAPNS
jgi:hypothetical protein